MTSPKEPVSLALYVSNVKNEEKKAIVSSNSGDLSLGEQAEVSDLKTGQDVVEPCQFEPELSLQRQVR